MTSDFGIDIEKEAWKQKNELDTIMQTSKTSAEGEIWKARGLLLAAAALYGTNFPVVKMLGDIVPVGIGATIRFGLASLVTLPWLLAPPTQEIRSKEDDTRLPAILAGIEVGSYNAVAYLAQAVGLETIDASKSAFICSLSVVIVPVLDFLTGKRMTRDQLIGAFMAVVGVAFLELGGAKDMTFSVGDLATFLQPIGFGLAFWRMEVAMHKYPHEAKRATAAQLLPVLLMSAVYSGMTDTVDVGQVVSWVTDPMVLFALFWTGVVTTACTLYMESLALKTLSAAETTLIFSTEPVWGAAFAALLMGEHLGAGSAAGAALVVAGCIFSSLGFQGLSNQLGSLMGAAPLAAALATTAVPASALEDRVDGAEEMVEEIVEEIVMSTTDIF
eukprot:CAMPEP_0116554336 /NCGR_PEP_ID=MMETSP0397-20121206/7537_1 /TAXON_ID=216820 /ORGANISM="Cyclophora tenuis, Strain ECT3854" /LENGTH=386 /DNA_ID=CAMNT_0004079489 /DNA_START=263 /DNA_END=1423 /DNA_ORIENTATION=+